MKNGRSARRTGTRRGGWRSAVRMLALAGATVTTLGACAHLAHVMGGSDVERPDAAEFGMGPRSSTTGAYRARLESEEPLRPRKLQSVRVVVTDAAGRPVDGAELELEGWMPEHGHGMPTRPRVTGNRGPGVYEVEGVRFNMGGWWEIEVAIRGAAGAESVTFNLNL